MTEPNLLSMSSTALERLYRENPIATYLYDLDIFMQGQVLLAPGTIITAPVSKLIYWMWRGKVFHGYYLRNSFTPLRIETIIASVYRGKSKLDGKKSIILDYSRSFLARWIRDEIREVSPGVYLGIVYIKNFRTIWFVLRKVEPH